MGASLPVGTATHDAFFFFQELNIEWSSPAAHIINYHVLLLFFKPAQNNINFNAINKVIIIEVQVSSRNIIAVRTTSKFRE